jgi:hypothetical protein
MVAYVANVDPILHKSSSNVAANHGMYTASAMNTQKKNHVNEVGKRQALPCQSAIWKSAI